MEKKKVSGFSPLGLLGAVLLCQAAGLVGLFLSGATGQSPWYKSLRKPAFTPPPRIFGPTWGILYSLMGVALNLLVCAQPRSRSALRLFGTQLFLNALWTPVFFGRRSITGALTVIAGLWAVLTKTLMETFRISRPAGFLLIPYWLWVGFATALNFEIWRLNPDKR